MYHSKKVRLLTWPMELTNLLCINGNHYTNQVPATADLLFDITESFRVFYMIDTAGLNS